MSARLRNKIEKYRQSGIEIGEDCKLYGTIERFHPEWIHIGRHVTLGTSSKIITHGPIRPYGQNPHIYIEDLVYTGYGCVILCGVTLGRGTMVGACSVVTRNTHSFSIVAGNPIRHIGWRTPKELLRTYLNKKLNKVAGCHNPDLKELTVEDIDFVFGLPRDTFPEGNYDPALNLIIEGGTEGKSVADILEILEIK